MNEAERKTLIQDINEIKKQNRETIFGMIPNLFLDYLTCLPLGQSEIQNEINNVFWELIDIYFKEKKILNNLIKDLENVNRYSVEEFLNYLDEIYENTINYYTEAIEDIEDAIEMNNPNKAKRFKIDFDTLMNIDLDKIYRSLFITKDTIFRFLNLPQDFINYITSDFHTYEILEIPGEENYDDWYGINYMLDDDGNLKNIKVFVPEIINIETALICVHEYERAYMLYNLLGKPLRDEDIETINEQAKMKKLVFEESQ